MPLAFLFDGLTVLVLPLRLGGEASQLGFVSLVGLGIAAGLQPVWGWLSDRYRDVVDRRSFVVVAAIPALVGVWILLGTSGIGAALVGYLVVQSGATALQAVQQTLIPEHVGEAERGRAAGFKVAFDVGGAFVAFLVLGTLVASGELRSAAIAVTVVVALGVALLLVLVPRGPRVSPAPTGDVPALPSGLGTLLASRFLFLFATYAVGRFLVLLVAERLGIDPGRAADEAGWLLALLTLTTAITALPLGVLADRVSPRDLMVSGSLVGAIGIVFLVPAAGLVGVVTGGLLMSFGTAAFVTGNWAATTAIVPAPASGRLMAIANLGTGFAAAAAGALGPLLDAAGFGPLLVIAAVASASAVVPLLHLPVRLRDHIRRETSP